MRFFHAFIFFSLILPLLFFCGCTVTQELTDLTTEDEFTAYCNKFAPSEDAFVAVQRLAKSYIDRNDWDRAVEVYERYKPKFPQMASRFEKIISILRAPMSKVQITNLGLGINSQYDEIKPTPTADGTRMYFASKDRPDGFGKLDLYVSRNENGIWLPAQNLGPAINTREHETINSISADGTKIVLYGAFEGHMGRGDNFYFEKTPIGWSSIKVFPLPINSPDWDSDGFFTADGKAFLFASDREGVVGERHPKGDPDFKMYPFHGSYAGNSDIFVSIKQGPGWSEPINLGSVINTPYCERSPFLHPDGKTLYFSSDGHPGLGRLDVFKSVRLREDSWTEWSTPVNLGKEINTADDDWGYKVSTDGAISYFAASGKMGGYGRSDIYSVTLPKEVQPEQKVIAIGGTVTDADGKPIVDNGVIKWEDLTSRKDVGNHLYDPNSGEHSFTLPNNKKLKGKYYSENGNLITGNDSLRWEDLLKKYGEYGVLIDPTTGEYIFTLPNGNKFKAKVFNEDGKLFADNARTKWDDLLKSQTSGELNIDPQTGEYTIYLPLGKKYGFFAEVEGYYPDSKTVDLSDVKLDPRNIRLNFNLKSIKDMLTKRDKWGELLAQRVNNIFFDFDKYDLKTESYLELDRLVHFLDSNPTLAIQIEAHTDDKGTDEYNLRLSEKRAQSVVNYIVDHNITSSRLKAKGHGESRPIGDNGTEEGAALNRRVEFRIAE